MSEVDPTSLALLGVLAALAVVLGTAWLVGALRRALRRRRDRTDVVIDLTYFEQAVQRTTAEGRRHHHDQLRSLSERRSTSRGGGGR